MNKKILLVIFLLLSMTIIAAEAEIYYPWKDVYIGSLEGKSWVGLVLAAHRESVFAFCIRVKKGGEIAEGKDFYFLVSEVGPHSPDGRYARVKFDLSLPFKKEKETPILKKPISKSDTMIFEWSRQDESSVIGRIRAPKNIEIQLIQYFPWNFKGTFLQLPDGQVKGESLSFKKYHYIFWTNREGSLNGSRQGSELNISYLTKKDRDIYFVAGIGEDAKILRNHIYRYKNSKTIDIFLREEERRYSKNRVKINGFYKGIEKAITNSIFWTTLYQPGNHRLYTPAGRRWIFPRPDGGQDYWTIFGWDSFFNALEVSIESSKHAKDIIKSVLQTQYPNGNIPNWRGGFGGTRDRSQPPVGAFIVLKLFQKIGDVDILKSSYPYLTKWHSFWKERKPNTRYRRDGNGDGLLEWGSDRELVTVNSPSWEEGTSGKQRAMWESGQDDLPNWDEAGFDDKTGTMTMNCLDLNCLYAFDAWCISQIANVLDKKEDFRLFKKEYEDIKKLINNELWDEREGFYFDRHWDGRFSKKKASSNFYPLLARIPDKNRAIRIVKHLLNENEFWGDYVIPTISRDDPAFSDQQYWRGTVCPPTNYLVYQGLKAYGFDEIATNFARKSAELFMRIWENFQLCPENFDSRTGEAGGHRYQSWGPLFALIALEEYIDFTPWEGFRFGILSPEHKTELSRLSIQGRHYDINISSRKIKLREEDKVILNTNGGAVFRHFLYSNNIVSFEIKSLEKRKLKINFLIKGKYQLLIDDLAKKVFKGKSVKFSVPEGEHTVLILLLENLT